jgi:ElaB/YqjD/DUF883 family membrane-anchored ribosome-binding protein
MSTTTARRKAVPDKSGMNESTDRLSSDLAELKTSYRELRNDVTKLLSNASGTAERRIVQKPLLSVAMAFGIGLVFARLFMRKR